MLSVNCFVVFIGVIVVLIKLSTVFSEIQEKKKVRDCLSVENWISYFIDLGVAGFGLYVYLELNQFNNLLGNILELHITGKIF